MIELTVTSSVPRPATVLAEQPTRATRWWMRHYRHIGLASSAGSAILICIIAIIALPIIVHRSSKKNDQCSSDFELLNKMMPSNVKTPANSTDSLSVTTSQATGSICQFPVEKYKFFRLHTGKSAERLCSNNVTWTNQGITIAGSSNGIASSTQAGLRNPNDLLIASDENLFIADSDNNRVMFWPVNSPEGCMIAGTGEFSSWIDSFKTAAAIAIWNNLLYVSDLNNYRLLAFPLSTTENSPEGTTIVGRYGLGSTLDQINYVQSMVVDRQRALFYLSDSRNHRILQLNLTDKTLHLIAGTGIAGSNNLSLNTPLGVTIDEQTGALYVADSENHRIQKFDLNSREGVTIVGGLDSDQNLSQLYLPSGVEIDSNGYVYVADTGNHRIIQCFIGSQQGRIIAGTGIAGTTETQLNNPVQLKFDTHRNLYVVDQKNNRIQRFDLLNNGC